MRYCRRVLSSVPRFWVPVKRKIATTERIYRIVANGFSEISRCQLDSWLLAADLNQPAEAFAVAEQLRAEVATERLGADVLDTLVEVYRRSGHQREALDLVSESLTRFPNSAILRYQHAAALLATSDEAQPRELARQELATCSRQAMGRSGASCRGSGNAARPDEWRVTGVFELCA